MRLALMFNVLQDDAYEVLQEAEDTTEGLRTQVPLPAQSFLLPLSCCCRTCMNAFIACMQAWLQYQCQIWEAVLCCVVCISLQVAVSSSSSSIISILNVLGMQWQQL